VKHSPAFATYPVDTIRDLLFKVSHRYGDRPAIGGKREGSYRSVSYQDLRYRVECLASYLLSLGLEKGDRVGVLSENRVEWALTYLATVASGLTVVPIDKELNDHEIRHILSFSEARVVMVSADYLRVLASAETDLPGIHHVICFDSTATTEKFFDDCLDTGATLLKQGSRQFEEVSVEPDDLAALIFTSGTTGAAKAVMLTHRNIVSNVIGTSFNVGIDKKDVLLSVLPLHHTYEATAGFLTALYQGAAIYYAESLRRVADNLKETRASVMLGVPALFEAMYRRIEAGIQQKGPGKVRLAKGVARISESLLGIDLRRRLFRELHERFGGRLRLLISGGAAVDPAVSRGFRELGIQFIQGYGLTEHSPIIAVNRVESAKDGSVGFPILGAEVRIEDEEILARGPGVMKGYYRNESATREAIRDGWLHTGDLGFFDRDGHLHISGRRKSVIVTPNGKNIYPEELETALNQSEFILESLVWGGPDPDPAQTEVQAIIVPDVEAFDRTFGSAGYDDDKLLEVVSAEVRKLNKQLSGYKRIRKFVLRRDEFEKTTTRKVKRYLYTAKSKPLEK